MRSLFLTCSIFLLFLFLSTASAVGIPIIDVKNQSGTITTSTPSIPIVDVNRTARVVSGGSGSGGGNISGSGVAEQIAVFSDTDELTGFNTLRYNQSSIILSDDGNVFIRSDGSNLFINALLAAGIYLTADQVDIIGTISASAFSGDWLPTGNGQSLGSPTQRLLNGWFSGSVNTTEVNATSINTKNINTTNLNTTLLYTRNINTTELNTSFAHVKGTTTRALLIGGSSGCEGKIYQRADNIMVLDSPCNHMYLYRGGSAKSICN